MPTVESQSPSDLAAVYQGIRAEAVRLAGGPGDMPQRVALLHSIFADSAGNHAFPEVALHGALWAYAFYERRGVLPARLEDRAKAEMRSREGWGFPHDRLEFPFGAGGVAAHIQCRPQPVAQ